MLIIRGATWFLLACWDAYFIASLWCILFIYPTGPITLFSSFSSLIGLKGPLVPLIFYPKPFAVCFPNGLFLLATFIVLSPRLGFIPRKVGLRFSLPSEFRSALKPPKVYLLELAVRPKPLEPDYKLIAWESEYLLTFILGLTSLNINSCSQL
jgi:hypothetical protein